MLLLPFKGIFPVRGPNEEMQYNMVIAALLHSDELCQLYILENVEHCGGEPEQADTGYYVTDR